MVFGEYTGCGHNLRRTKAGRGGQPPRPLEKMLAVIWDATEMLKGKLPRLVDFIPESADDTKRLAEYGFWQNEAEEVKKLKVLTVMLAESDVLAAGDCRPESLRRLENALYRMENLAEGIGKKRVELQNKGWKLSTYLDRYKGVHQQNARLN